MNEKDLARFMAKVNKTDTCWLWTAGKNCVSGYGTFGLAGRDRTAHAVAYEHFIGPVPEGLELDHLCRVRACCNPAHLEPVTHAENVRRGERANRTHCPAGHEYNEANTQVVRRDPSHRQPYQRLCRACKREKMRQYAREGRLGARKSRSTACQ